MIDRWRTTRARLGRETGSTDTTGLWSRIDESRRAGMSVDLPSSDPRRTVSPLLLSALALVAAVALITLRDRSMPAPVASVASTADDAAVDWLTTPAYAQGNGTSNLPPIDPPDLSRMQPGRLVYQHMGGADGFITQQEGTDTSWVARDTIDGMPRLLLSRTNQKGNRYSDTDALESLAIGGDGRLLFWRWQVTNHRKDRVVILATTLLRDSVQFTIGRKDSLPRQVRTRPGNYEYQLHDLLLSLLPALPLQLGYARSISVLDLVRGETTPGFTRSVEMRVTGKTWVKVPIGRFQCWVVDYSVVPEPGEKRYTSRLFVDMNSGSLVRAEWKFGESFIAEQFLVDRQASR